jgi:hypothetical protein
MDQEELSSFTIGGKQYMKRIQAQGYVTAILGVAGSGFIGAYLCSHKGLQETSFGVAMAMIINLVTLGLVLRYIRPYTMTPVVLTGSALIGIALVPTYAHLSLHNWLIAFPFLIGICISTFFLNYFITRLPQSLAPIS